MPPVLPANPMPRHGLVHRRGRRYNPMSGARSPALRYVGPAVMRRWSTGRRFCFPKKITRGQTECAEEHVRSVQEPQAAITTTSSVSRILARLEFEWGCTIYIRFRQQDDTSTLDLVIQQELYWPDGTSKHSKSRAKQRARDQMREMAQALVDKYNEDHHLSGDLAYELKDVLNFNSISEHQSCYYHINFSTNSKAANDSERGTSNIFFAEVKLFKQGKHRELFICCFCTVDTINNGQPCKACNNPDKFDIKHPDSSVELAAGHLDPRTQFSGFMREIDFYDSEDEDRYLRDKEAELRRVYKGLDEPHAIERLFTLPPGVTIVQD